MTYPHHRFIQSYVHQARVGVLVEFAVESDFATRTDEFQELARSIAVHIAGMNPPDVAGLLQQAFAQDSTRRVADVLDQAKSDLRENILITRFVRWDTDPPAEKRPEPPSSPAVAVRFRRG